MKGELLRAGLVGMFVALGSAACTLHSPGSQAAGGAAGEGVSGTAGRSGAGRSGDGGRAGGEPVVGGAGAADGQAGGCQGAECPGCAASNACGGCAELPFAPGAACGECGKYECAPDKESVSCVDQKLNACGGCGTLASAPNSSCGNCGDWQCTADKTDVRCSGVNVNACGGCGTLAQAPGGSCGVCGTYECSADKSKTTCNDPGLNACGGCTVFNVALGSSCGACAVTTCASSKNALVCSPQCTAGQVCVPTPDRCKTPDCSAPDSCGNSDGAGALCTGAAGKCPAKPNATGSCVDSSCAYACTGSKLSCSTASEPACATWSFESNGVEGWGLSSREDSASSGDLYATAAPGSGAGARSLAVNLSGSDVKTVVEVYVELCKGANATGIQGSFLASVWFKPSDGLGGASGPAYAYPNNATGSGVGGIDASVPANQWFDVASNPIAGEEEVGVAVHVGGLANRKGVLYFDNMRFE